MLLIAGTVRLPPERIDEARPAMAAVVTASRAEDGCLAYAYAFDLLDAGLVHVSEAWRDRAALERHVATPHLTAWRAAGQALGIHARDLRLYETDEGVAV